MARRRFQLSIKRRAGALAVSIFAALLTPFGPFVSAATSSGRQVTELDYLPEHIASLTLTPCRPKGAKETVRCGTYEAEENRLHPNGRRLPLKVVVISARRPTGSEPLIFLAGGPGEAATDYAAEMINSPLRLRRDLVLIDQRGTNDGHRLDCPMEASPDDVQVYLDPLFSRLAFWSDCARQLSRNADLSQYSTPVAATDVDEVRQALGYSKVNVMGGSYGSRHAMDYVKMFGEHVHAVFLSGLSPLEIKSPLYQPQGADRAFNLMAADCEKSVRCKAAFPHLRADLRIVLASLDTKPARVSVKNPATGKRTDVILSRDAFAEGVRAKLYSASDARDIPLLLAKARRGDFREVTQSSLDFGYEGRKGFNVAMGLSANCSEDTSRITRPELEHYTAGTMMGQSLVAGKMAVCAMWPPAWLPANHFAPFLSHVPAMLLSGYYDPVTPPIWGEVSRKHFPNSVHVVVKTGHSLGKEAWACTVKLANQLFDTADPKRINLSCARKLSLPQFVSPSRRPKRSRI